MASAVAKLNRTTLRTSRLLDFCSRKELIAQTGHQPDAWPLVVLKELVDNALDACEEAEVAPEITIQVDDNGITVTDNGVVPQNLVGRGKPGVSAHRRLPSAACKRSS